MDILSTAFEQVSSLPGFLWSSIYLLYVSKNIIDSTLCTILQYLSIYPMMRIKCFVSRDPEFKMKFYMPRISRNLDYQVARDGDKFIASSMQYNLITRFFILINSSYSCMQTHLIKKSDNNREKRWVLPRFSGQKLVVDKS